MAVITETSPPRLRWSLAAVMFHVVAWQTVAAIGSGLLLWALCGVAAMTSLLAGSFVCIVPNALFAMRLAVVTLRSHAARPQDFFAGELVKIAATILLLALAARALEPVVWWALIAGMIVALKSYWLALIRIH